MKREERIERASSLEEVVDLLSKSQLSVFAGVIAWYQTHNHFFYFLDERGAKRFLIDKCIGTKLGGKPISLRRLIVLDHIETYKREEMTNNLIKLGKEAAKNKDVWTLNEIVKEMKI